jgi:hypothetical protein
MVILDSVVDSPPPYATPAGEIPLGVEPVSSEVGPSVPSAREVWIYAASGFSSGSLGSSSASAERSRSPTFREALRGSGFSVPRSLLSPPR